MQVRHPRRDVARASGRAWRRLGPAAALVGVAFVGATSTAQDPPPPETARRTPRLEHKDESARARAEGLARTHGVLELGLTWLMRHQDPSGSWDADGFMANDMEGEPCSGAGHATHDVGVTGLAMLALLGENATAMSTAQHESVRRAAQWLVTQQEPKHGRLGAANAPDSIYDHAIGTLALVEYLGRTKDKVQEPAAQRAIDYLEFHRNPYGTWRYQPRDGDNDTSVTGFGLLACASARQHGLRVNRSVFELGRTWLDQLTDPVTFRTGYTERGGWSSRHAGDHATRFPRERGECMTALAVSAKLRIAGAAEKSDELLEGQRDLIATKPPNGDPTSGAVDELYWYFGTRALHGLGDVRWQRWSTALDAALVRRQRNDGNFTGSWDPVGVWGEVGGRVYSTALGCLTLRVVLGPQSR